MDLSISNYSYGKEFNRTLITVKQFELLDAVCSLHHAQCRCRLSPAFIVWAPHAVCQCPALPLITSLCAVMNLSQCKYIPAKFGWRGLINHFLQLLQLLGEIAGKKQQRRWRWIARYFNYWYNVCCISNWYTRHLVPNINYIFSI